MAERELPTKGRIRKLPTQLTGDAEVDARAFAAAHSRIAYLESLTDSLLTRLIEGDLPDEE